MNEETYILGGSSSYTSNILKHEKDIWQDGPEIPGLGLNHGCGVKVSNNAFFIIGGTESGSRILKFTTDDTKWHNTSMKLNPGVEGLACIVFNNKVIITGGHTTVHSEYSCATYIIDINNDGDFKMRSGNCLNEKRAYHGMGIIQTNNGATVIAFGGYNLMDRHIVASSVEIWNDSSETWQFSNVPLIEARQNFGFATLPTELLCP